MTAYHARPGSLALAILLTTLACCTRENTQPTPVATSANETSPKCCSQTEAASAPMAEDSLFQLDSTWQDQEGRTRKLAEWRGSPLLVAMVFTHCAYACPQIVSDLHEIDRSLAPEQRKQLRIVLVSFDHVRDVPKRLATWAESKGMDERWTLLHGSASSIREFAAVLGVNYRPVGDTGDFAHSNRITVLDAEGRALRHVDGLNADSSLVVDELQSRLPRN